MTTEAVHPEESTIRAFIQKSKQERCIAMLRNPKLRRKFTSALAHFKWLDERFAHAIPPSIAHTADEWVSLLRSKGASQTAWAISEQSSIDGLEVNLRDVLQRVIGSGMGTILSCVPGRLAYFEDEENRYLLERQSVHQSR